MPPLSQCTRVGPTPDQSGQSLSLSFPLLLSVHPSFLNVTRGVYVYKRCVDEHVLAAYV